jgi:hypothetical protein
LVGALLGLVVGPATGWAQAPGNIAAQVNAHLRAGEFGPALRLAQGVADPALRDRLLAGIVRAQAAGGARQAAMQAAGGMSDDRRRSDALSQLNQASAASDGAPGGGQQADFDTLIDLIQATIAPQSWDTVGGPGAIDDFPGGVYVDTGGLMKRLALQDGGRDLARLRRLAFENAGNQDPRKQSALRKVSLTRLEKLVQQRWALGRPPTEAMKLLAGLHKVQYVFVYPEAGDIVLAGPAGDWTVDKEGRAVNAETGRPALQLDDFVVLLRNAQQHGGRFTCSITPRQENLAATQAFLTESAKTPLRPEQRGAWLAKIRKCMGTQAITVENLEPQTRVARVIVEADYRMKLIGMGLEEGVLGVISYLDSIQIPVGGSAPPMNVLRLWFTTNYDALRATPARNAFELRGTGVKVLSENEMLTERGGRIHTGKSDELTEQFAHRFTKHFDALAAKYPIYADLQNVFDLALVAAVLMAEDLPGQVRWHATHFGQAGPYRVALSSAPSEVDTVVHHRVIHNKHIVVGMSGGVSFDATKYVQKSAAVTDDYGSLKAGHTAAAPRELAADAWWWD